MTRDSADHSQSNAFQRQKHVLSEHTSVSSVNMAALIGSVCLWSWVDSLYLSLFFGTTRSRILPEVATWLTFLVCAAVGIVMILKRSWAASIPAKKNLLVATGILGSIGSTLFAVSGLFEESVGSATSMFLLVIGAVFSGIFMATSVFSWGSLYCSKGLRTMSIYFAGAFALTFIPDLLFALITKPISCFAPATLPVLANCLLLLTPTEWRVFPSTTSSGNKAAHTSWHKKVSSTLRHNLGIKAGTVCSMIFVMFGLGYMQDAISFSRLFTAPGFASLLAISLPRCALAGVVLLVAIAAPRWLNLIYKLGLLAIIAGFSLIPLVSGTRLFWLPGTVMLSGYATFDILIWGIVAQTIYARFGDPVLIMSFMRLVANGFACVLGGSVGMLFASQGGVSSTARAIFVGYLITVAAVLILSDRDVWDLLSDARMDPLPASGAPSESIPSVLPAESVNSASHLDQRITTLAQEWSLTEREREVFALLAVGRTQPWIANELSISDSTVNTHVRHIYGKAGINSRQELLDLVFRASSPESIDIEKGAR